MIRILLSVIDFCAESGEMKKKLDNLLESAKRLGLTYSERNKKNTIGVNTDLISDENGFRKLSRLRKLPASTSPGGTTTTPQIQFVDGTTKISSTPISKQQFVSIPPQQNFVQVSQSQPIVSRPANYQFQNVQNVTGRQFVVVDPKTINQNQNFQILNGKVINQNFASGSNQKGVPLKINIQKAQMVTQTTQNTTRYNTTNSNTPEQTTQSPQNQNLQAARTQASSSVSSPTVQTGTPSGTL